MIVLYTKALQCPSSSLEHNIGTYRIVRICIQNGYCLLFVDHAQPMCVINRFCGDDECIKKTSFARMSNICVAMGTKVIYLNVEILAVTDD